MKKSSNQNDIHQEGQEQSKKLYRSISESARRLDDAHSCAHNVSDLFTPILQIQRSKFQEYCERLIFSEPALYGRKGEELLWRKAYYDVISAAKRLKKKEFSEGEVCNIHTHINAGVGHYHHFISRLQHHFGFELKDCADFPIFKNHIKKANDAVQKPEHLEWAQQSAHRCLIYLGDLNRYKLEIYPNWDPMLAIQYYIRAAYLKPDYGIPHNQMGTLALNQNRFLDAVYHYMCCLACKHTFEGTENNLSRLLEKNAKSLDEFFIESHDADVIVQLEPVDHIKRFTSRFLFLVDAWYFNKKVPDIYILCHQTSMDLQECFSYLKPTFSENGDTQTTDGESIETDSLATPSYITDEMIFKVVIVCLFCIAKLQKLHSHQISTTTAFTLAVYSQLLQVVTDRVHDNLLNVVLSHTDAIFYNHTNGIVKHDNKTHKKKQSVRRRRKKKHNSSDEESEVSDSEVVELGSNSDVSQGDSANELCFSSSDNESEDDILSKENSSINETDESANKKPEVEKNENGAVSTKSFTDLALKIKKLDPNLIIDALSGEKLLYSIKFLNEWLTTDTEIIKSCGKSTRSLLKQITHLLNFLNVDVAKIKFNLKLDVNGIKQDNEKIPLPENLLLKGIEIFPGMNYNFNWDFVKKKSLSVADETAVRIGKLVSFGHFLAQIEETGISYDEKKQLFVIQEVDLNVTDANVNDIELLIGESTITHVDNSSPIKEVIPDSRGQLTKMKHMGQLWLAAEVRALENRVRGKTSLSPYLVLDADCLLKFSIFVKHLVSSKKFIVIIPTAVVSALDDLKREKSEARDAIRWLEFQLHHGNRFCRAQRPQERASLPLIKYPKKKDKTMFIYIQIIECCHHFAQQQKDATDLVTLLVGNDNALNTENKEISYTGLAHSAGINLEFMTNFYEKWRKSFKGKK